MVPGDTVPFARAGGGPLPPPLSPSLFSLLLRHPPSPCRREPSLYVLRPDPRWASRPVPPHLLHCFLVLVLRRYQVVDAGRFHVYWYILSRGWYPAIQFRLLRRDPLELRSSGRRTSRHCCLIPSLHPLPRSPSVRRILLEHALYRRPRLLHPPFPVSLQTGLYRFLNFM